MLNEAEALNKEVRAFSNEPCGLLRMALHIVLGGFFFFFRFVPGH